MRWRRLILFLLMGLTLHGAVSLVFVVLMREHKAFRSDRAFARSRQPIDLLVCGDSHPRTAIDPRLLGDRVVNVAIGGEHYIKTWYRMRALVERTERPVQALMLPLDPVSFSSWHADNFAPEYVWGRYVDFLDLGVALGEPRAYVARALKGTIAPYAGELRTFNQLRTGRYGFGENLPTGSFSENPESERRFIALQDARVHFRDQEVLDPGLKWAFDSLVAWATERHIRLVFVAFPVTEAYGGWVARTGARERIQQEVVDPLVADGHLFIDDHELLWGRDEFFSDSHHLNTAGRVAFTNHLRPLLEAEGIVVPR